MDSQDSVKRLKRIQCKSWFCTWPQCPLSKEEALKILDSKKEDFSIVEYVICEEKHEDGNPHLHAFLKLSKKKTFNSNLFDLDKYHGNYQTCKSWRAVIQYVKKDGDYISNFDVKKALSKKGKWKKEDLLKDIDTVLDEGLITPMQVANFYKNQQIYKMLGNKRDKMPDKLPPKRRHLWFYGPSNTGKTFKLRQMMKDTGEEKWFQMPLNNDWIGYTGERYLYYDEYKGQYSVQHLNSICDGNYKVNVKGGSTWIPWNCQVIICSNYSIEDCYSKCDSTLIASLKNRFKEVQLVFQFNSKTEYTVLKKKPTQEEIIEKVNKNLEPTLREQTEDDEMNAIIDDFFLNYKEEDDDKTEKADS